MSTPRRAFAVLFVSAAIATPILVADPVLVADPPTLGDDLKQVVSECSPPACGNGKVQPSKGEVCDDGNNVSGDGCSADCRSQETCGNGTVDVATGEQCDTSGQTPTCNADCTVAFCGDGKVNASRGEACDTGGPSATCNVFCQFPACGNGVVEAPEQCDDGNAINNDSCTNQCQFNCSPESASAATVPLRTLGQRLNLSEPLVRSPFFQRGQDGGQGLCSAEPHVH
jgi:cysteine-rich repeat protein